MPTDENLMARYQLGDLQAFEALYARYEGKLMGYLRKKGLPAFEADEVFQKIFIRFHETRLAYSEKYPLSAWIFTLTRHALADHFRIRKTWAPLPENLPAPEATTPETPPLEVLQPEEREILQSRYFDEKTYEEISRTLGISQEAVRQKVSRAIRKLRDWMPRRPS